jgi:hypothetical protein
MADEYAVGTAGSDSGRGTGKVPPPPRTDVLRQVCEHINHDNNEDEEKATHA